MLRDDQPGGRGRDSGAARRCNTRRVAGRPSIDDDQITTLSPAVRRAVLEYHVDPSKIKGTGKDGRLTKDDVLAAAQAQKAAPAPAPGAAGESASRASGAAAPAPQASRLPPQASARKSASR